MARVIGSTPVAEKVARSTSWDGKHELEYHEKGRSHWYVLDGNKVRGATSFGGAYPKAEALIRWMVKQGIEEFQNKTQLHKGAEVGTVLHNFAESHERGTAFDWAPVEASPYKADMIRVIQRFLKWRGENADKILRAEDIIASPATQSGGKIDTLRERPGVGLVLSDYKTSKNIYTEQLIQVIGGYRRMFREWLNIDVPFVEIVTFPKLAEDDMHVLLADKDGWVKDGERVNIPNLFDKIEAQYARNVGTFWFREEVDRALFPPKE